MVLGNMMKEIFFQYFTACCSLRYTYSIKLDISVSPMKLSYGGGFGVIFLFAMTEMNTLRFSMFAMGG
jgi:hypothetical protein